MTGAKGRISCKQTPAEKKKQTLFSYPWKLEIKHFVMSQRSPTPNRHFLFYIQVRAKSIKLLLKPHYFHHLISLLFFFLDNLKN